MRAKFINLTYIRNSSCIVVGVPGLCHGKILGVTSSGSVLYVRKEPQVIMYLAGPNAKCITLNIYRDIKTVYPHKNVTENLVNKLRDKLYGMTFEVEHNMIPNIQSILHTIDLE